MSHTLHSIAIVLVLLLSAYSLLKFAFFFLGMCLLYISKATVKANTSSRSCSNFYNCLSFTYKQERQFRVYHF